MGLLETRSARMPKANVLIVEDSAPDAMLMKIALDAGGFDYKLISLRDGAKALEYVHAQSATADADLPDIILLDMNIPKANGLEILREIRSVDRLAKIPVLVLSSSQSPRDRSAVLSLADARFERKPSDLDGYLELGRNIRLLLETSRKFSIMGADGG